MNYEPADTTFIVNDGDPDLRPIRLSLPSPPRLELIDGYGLPAEKQRFKRLEIPVRLKQLEQKIIDVLNKKADTSQFVITYYSLSKEFWDTIDRERDNYKEEIKFIKRVWWYRLNGYWFFNYGKPTYMAGWHFMYLNFWFMSHVKPDQYPHYRDRDRREFLFHQYAYTTTETFTRLDDAGWAIPEEDGSYKMIDLGRRVCYGLGQPKNRRSGNTNKGLCINMEIVTRTVGTDGAGIISYTGANAEKHFKGKVVPAWNAFPIFLRPFCTSKLRPQSLVLDVHTNDFKNKGLGTTFTYADSADAKSYDGLMLVAILSDENGKCFGKGTKLKMFDGSVKNVENIRVGDLLMGDDSTPRKVLKLARGRDDMYKIFPNCGDPWICNGDHILSLKVSYEGLLDKYIKNDTIEIPLTWFLLLKKYVQKGLMLYKVGVEYEEKHHELPPYLLGAWLGDGHSKAFSITNEDKEIVNYLYDFAKEREWNISIGGEDNIYSFGIQAGFKVLEYQNGGLVREFKNQIDAAHYHGRTSSWHIKLFNKNKDPNYYFDVIKKKKPLRHLRELNLIGNKHIPSNYLIDSAKNRLELLAGLIDTDGHRLKGNKMLYEITQKRKILAYNIVELVRSLGFKATIKSKIASMKRKDGSYYRCEVYRVSIYGNDLYRIPCLVERKKYYQKELHSNTRNPLRSGFVIEPIGVGNYYGFVIDGNRRFLLDDYTVVHNTSKMEADVDERNRVLVNCLSQGNGMIIHGYIYHPSTVDEYIEGGFAYRNMMNASSFYQRVKSSGQPPSGVFRLFMSGEEGLDGFIDSYGYSVRGEINDYQRTEGFKKTSDEYLTGIKEHFLKQDTPESQEAYRSQRKLFPQHWADCWIGEAGEIGFDIGKIDDQITEIRRRIAFGDKPTIKGNFEWKNDIFGEEVEFIQDEENGRFEVSDMARDRANKRIRDVMWDAIDQMEKEVWTPYDPLWGTAGGDPFRFKKKAEVKYSYSKHSMSDGGFCVVKEYDAKIDGNRPRSEWNSVGIACTYRYRPKTDDEFTADCLKACIWYGVHIYPEMNFEIIYKNFRQWGYGGYLKHDVLENGQMKDEPGTRLYTQSKQAGFSYARNFINYHSKNIWHLDLLMECKLITNMDDLQNYDLLASFMCALIGSKSKYSQIMKQGEAEVNIKGLMELLGYQY